VVDLRRTVTVGATRAGLVDEELGRWLGAVECLGCERNAAGGGLRLLGRRGGGFHHDIFLDLSLFGR
jgi:hypothetical protein